MVLVFVWAISIYNKSNTSAVENINLEYNFIIVPAGTDKIRRYKINVDMPSRLGLWEKNPDVAVGPINFTRMFSDIPGRVVIEYIDYAAARHFLTQVNEWFEALETSPERFFLKRLQGMSHWFRDLFPALAVIFILFIFYKLTTKNAEALYSSNDIVSIVCLVSIFAVFAWMMGGILGRLTEWGVDRVQPLSYVNLNRGDEKCIARRSQKNFFSSLVGIGGFIFYLI